MSAWRANIVGLGHVRIEVDSGVIARVERLGPEEPATPFLSPGLIDLQINGFAGVDFSGGDLTVEAIEHVLPLIWATGCTSFCPTLITSTHERLERNFGVLEEARRRLPLFAASTPCYHLEGPYLSPGPSRGAHDPGLMRPPDPAEFDSLQAAAGGNIGILTLAPELPGALELTRRATAAGVLVGIGHTDGSRADVHAAAAAGAAMSTHLGNGCPATIHRHDAPFWAQLACDELQACIICDGFHLPAEHVKIIHRVKGTNGCILVTDAVHVVTRPPGTYSFGGGEIQLLPSGQVVRADGGSMAGSTLSMQRAVATFMAATGLPLAEALLPATANPARLLRRASVCQGLSPGQPANFVLFDLADGQLAVRRTILSGVCVHGDDALATTAGVGVTGSLIQTR